MKKTPRKLVLHRETIVQLSDHQLARAGGGTLATADCFIMKDTIIIRTGIIARP